MNLLDLLTTVVILSINQLNRLANNLIITPSLVTDMLKHQISSTRKSQV